MQQEDVKDGYILVKDGYLPEFLISSSSALPLPGFLFFSLPKKYKIMFDFAPSFCLKLAMWKDWQVAGGTRHYNCRSTIMSLPSLPPLLPSATSPMVTWSFSPSNLQYKKRKRRLAGFPVHIHVFQCQSSTTPEGKGKAKYWRKKERHEV